MNQVLEQPVSRVNGVALHPPGQQLDKHDLQQRAWTELLRQTAQREGLLDSDDEAGDDGVISQVAADAIEQLLECHIKLPAPSEENLRRYHDAHRAHFARGEAAWLRHVLFAVTPGLDVNALRKRAEAMLLQLRCATPDSDEFAQAATQWSNCPSGATGGDLGWLTEQDCAPEFAREVFGGQTQVGVMAQLVHSRFGLHVVQVIERRPGDQPPFEQVRDAVAAALRQHGWMNGLRHYLKQLGAGARLDHLDLDITDSPLVQ
jgi:peptidyl-prolyl cis-trans isomerase C